MKIKILFLLLPIFLFAQKQKIQLLDYQTKKPLQFVELLYNNESLFSDKNGNVFVDFKDNKMEVLDGNYKPNLIEISKDTETIELQNIVTELEELIISKKPRTIINPQKRDLFKLIQIRTENVTLSEIVFKPEYQNKYLRKISFKTLSEIFFKSDVISAADKKKLKNGTFVLKINILDKNKKQIYTSNVFEYKQKKKTNFEVDILDDILITNEPIFIEIQLLGALDDLGLFLKEKNYTLSTRPEQAKRKPVEYDVNVWTKKRNSILDFRNENKPGDLNSYINFGFEFEDAE